MAERPPEQFPSPRPGVGPALARLFIYGTLLPGESAEGLLRPVLLSSQDATVGGELILVDGRYPALVAGGGGTVVGRVVAVSPVVPTLLRLDEYEGSEYRRVVLNVTVDGKSPLAAWAYLLRRDATASDQRIPGGRWANFRR